MPHPLSTCPSLHPQQSRNGGVSHTPLPPLQAIQVELLSDEEEEAPEDSWVARDDSVSGKGSLLQCISCL